MSWSSDAYMLALVRERGSESMPHLVQRVMDAGSAQAAWEASGDGLFDDLALDDAVSIAESDLTGWKTSGYDVVTFLDPRYPQKLRTIHEMPPIIWTRGDLQPADVGVAVVGTRTPTPRAIKFTQELVALLAADGITVVSGLAEGIDTCAHRAALDLGARTVGIIGTGIDQSYPPSNIALQEQVATSGLLLSQFAPGSSPTKFSFPMRNAVMSGYGHASIVIEAGEHSGTRSQTRLAIAHGRPVILSETVATTTSWGHKYSTAPGVSVATTPHSAATIINALLAGPPPQVRELMGQLSA